MRPAAKGPTAAPTWSIELTKPIIVPSEISPNKLDDSSVSNMSRLLKAKPKITANRKSDHIPWLVTDSQSMDTASKAVRMMVVLLMPILSAIKPSGIIATVDTPPIVARRMAAVVDETPTSMA